MKLFNKKSLVLVSIVLSFSFNIFSQSKTEITCGTVTSPEFINHYNSIKQELKTFEQDFMQMKSGKTYTSKKEISNIPIKIHIIRNSDGSGGLSTDNLNNALAELNATYADAFIGLSLYEGVNYIDNDQLCHFQKGNENELIKNNYVPGIINVYFTEYIENYSDESICGYSKNEKVNTIFIKNSCATNGSSLAHEFGHFFSLVHTHGLSSELTTEFVDGSNCDTDGDSVCDTPADPGLSNKNIDNFCNYIGELKDAHGDSYKPDTNNIMSYSRKACRNHFSNGQLARMYAYYKIIEKRITSPNVDFDEITTDKINDLANLRLYPNPVTKGKINFNVSKIEEAVRFQIVNLQGQMLSQGIATYGEIDVNYLSSGSYLLILENSNSKAIKRFIK
ncbi:zinc-dependent metalloprotease [Sabulilitoribacter multivorans]|uniref:Zinc-dependent metalloprotease n=1 Tax=Flaviramulus multivorans TaxID=1304750 RepID=A0ABS9IJ07_9FLAO|nr:zinc-dependent metalloprotease [Flaviramulus multivorans]MCF7560275.1 zinc-dependent metalloprotease [Flaviramulus multivorans]